jgi:hypothetical protein
MPGGIAGGAGKQVPRVAEVVFEQNNWNKLSGP